MGTSSRALLRFQNTISCCCLSSGDSYNTLICWFSHDVTKIQTKKLSILPRFYFHDALGQLKTNCHTNFRFKRVLGFVIERKSLDNHDRNQVEPAIPKTSCGLAHSFVPKWHSEEPFCDASVAELWSCTSMSKIKKGESIQRIKGDFFLIHPWLCCNNNVCFKVEIFVNLVQVVVIRLTTTWTRFEKQRGITSKYLWKSHNTFFMNLKPLS